MLVTRILETDGLERRIWRNKACALNAFHMALRVSIEFFKMNYGMSNKIEIVTLHIFFALWTFFKCLYNRYAGRFITTD